MAVCFGAALGVALGVLGSSSPHPESGPAAKAAWTTWAAQFRPTLASFDRDYARTGADLGRDDQAAARSDLLRLAADARRLRDLADSGDPKLNGDLSALASSISAISAIGLAHWPLIDETSFGAAVSRYAAASATFERAFAAEGAAVARSS